MNGQAGSEGYEALQRENARLRSALEAYPEWLEDRDDWGDTNGYVTCLICDGGGKFNEDGKPSKRLPPTHKLDCARQLALAAEAKEQVQPALNADPCSPEDIAARHKVDSNG